MKLINIEEGSEGFIGTLEFSVEENEMLSNVGFQTLISKGLQFDNVLAQAQKELKEMDEKIKQLEGEKAPKKRRVSKKKATAKTEG